MKKNVSLRKQILFLFSAKEIFPKFLFYSLISKVSIDSCKLAVPSH